MVQEVAQATASGIRWDVYIALGIQLLIQVLLLAFLYGKLTQRLHDVEGRVERIENFIDAVLRRAFRIDLEVMPDAGIKRDK